MTPDTANANIQPVLSAIRSLLIVAGTLLAGHGLGDTGLYCAVQVAAGSVFIVGPALWGVWTAIQNYRHKKSLTHDNARLLDIATIALVQHQELRSAAKGLIADVRDRHPGEDLRCPHMQAIDTALAK